MLNACSASASCSCEEVEGVECIVFHVIFFDLVLLFLLGLLVYWFTRFTGFTEFAICSQNSDSSPPE